MAHGTQGIPTEHREYGIITRMVLAYQFGRACGRPTTSSQDIRERPRPNPGSVDSAWRNGSGAPASLARRSRSAELERTCGPRRNRQTHFRLARGRITSRCCVGGVVRTAAASLSGKHRRGRFAGYQDRVEGPRGPITTNLGNLERRGFQYRATLSIIHLLRGLTAYSSVSLSNASLMFSLVLDRMVHQRNKKSS